LTGEKFPLPTSFGSVFSSVPDPNLVFMVKC
jgi:hypothetical protein